MPACRVRTRVSLSKVSLSKTHTQPAVGLYKQAFRFGVTANDVLLVPESPLFDVSLVTMMAWVRPLAYSCQGSAFACTDEGNSADHAIIMNREHSYEMGLDDVTGALQGAGNIGGCWCDLV